MILTNINGAELDETSVQVLDQIWAALSLSNPPAPTFERGAQIPAPQTGEIQVTIRGGTHRAKYMPQYRVWRRKGPVAPVNVLYVTEANTVYIHNPAINRDSIIKETPIVSQEYTLAQHYDPPLDLRKQITGLNYDVFVHFNTLGVALNAALEHCKLPTFEKHKTARLDLNSCTDHAVMSTGRTLLEEPGYIRKPTMLLYLAVLALVRAKTASEMLKTEPQPDLLMLIGQQVVPVETFLGGVGRAAKVLFPQRYPEVQLLFPHNLDNC